MELVRESVFNQNFRFVNEITDIKQYFSEFSELLRPVESCKNEKCKKNEVSTCQKEDCKNDIFYTSLLKLSKEQLQELKEKTSVEHLTCPGEKKPVPHDYYKKFTDEDVIQIPGEEEEVEEVLEIPLTSVRAQSKTPRAFRSDMPRRFFKYNNIQWCLKHEKLNRNKLDFSCDDFSSVVACVRVYHPFLSARNKGARIKLMQEIHILGNQKLSQLRDKILCSLDLFGVKDESAECHLKQVGMSTTAKDEYPSSFIFIEDVFYNDTRKSDLEDLSKEIREWCPGRGMGPFEVKSMENTRICDLKVRVGQPYVYVHQGGCEHVVVFSDLRFFEMGDPSTLSGYPRTHSIGRNYGKHCMMCADSYARWVVIGNERLTHDKAFLCKKCFFSYNYLDGKKIGNFQAFRYVDPVALL